MKRKTEGEEESEGGRGREGREGTFLHVPSVSKEVVSYSKDKMEQI